MTFRRWFVLVILLVLATVISGNELDSLKKENKKLKEKLALLGFQNTEDYLPIPKESFPYEANQKNGLSITKIVKDVYFLTDSAYSSAVIDIGKSLVVIDAPPSMLKERILETLSNSSIFKKKKVSHFIYSHAHSDHVALACAFDTSKTTFISHIITAKLLKRNKALPTPTVLINKNNTAMKLGNKNLVFRYYENSHVEGGLAIWLPDEKVFIYIDVVFPRWIPFYSLGITQDPIRYFELFDIILTYDFKYMISGHLGRPVARADLKLARDYMADMKSIVLESLTMFNLTDYYTQFGGAQSTPNHWAVLHNWEGDMAAYCAQKLLKKYTGVLAGVDVYAWSGCWILREGITLAQN